MRIKKVILILTQCLSLFILCSPGVVYAQENPYNSTVLRRENIHISRVVDPWSKNTVWIDKYLTSNSTVNQPNQDDIANKVVFNFRVNSFLFELDYMDNARSIAIIDQIFSDSSIYKTNNLTVITGSASPEGYLELNEKLASQRAWAIKSYIMWKHPTVDRDKISTYSIGEQWDGLLTMVEQDSLMPGREQVLQILNTKLTGTQKMGKIKALNQGRTYEYMKLHTLPSLRGGVSCTFYTLDPITKEPILNQTTIVEYRDRVVERFRVDTVYIEKPPAPKAPVAPKRLLLAVKTNMLYDLGLLPNLAVEIPIGERWSVEAQGMESWWNTSNNKRYFHRIQIAGLELRRWFGNRYTTPLTGHFFGLYAMGGTYDIKFNATKGSLSDWSYSAGITYGYSTPIARRFNLEFSLGVGYVSGDYKTYGFNCETDCYPLISKLKRSYFGPTKAQVSLVYLIGNGFRNRTKR